MLLGIQEFVQNCASACATTNATHSQTSEPSGLTTPSAHALSMHAAPVLVVHCTGQTPWQGTIRCNSGQRRVAELGVMAGLAASQCALSVSSNGGAHRVAADFAQLHREVAEVWQLGRLAMRQQARNLVLKECLVIAALEASELNPDDDFFFLRQCLHVLLHAPQQQRLQHLLDACSQSDLRSSTGTRCYVTPGTNRQSCLRCCGHLCSGGIAAEGGRAEDEPHITKQGSTVPHRCT